MSRRRAPAPPARRFFVGPDDPRGRADVLEAALGLFARRGLDGVSMRDLADAAGVTAPAIYKHFASKQALAVFLYEACHARVWSQHEAALAAAGADPDARLARYVASYVDLMAREPDALMFLHDHTATLWPHVSEPTRSRRLVDQAADLAARFGLRGPARFTAGVAILGTLAHLGRLLALDAVPGPAARWEAELRAVIGRIVGAGGQAARARRRGAPSASRARSGTS